MEKRHTISRSRSAGLLLVALAWALFLALTGSPEAVLFTVPVFLLAAPLAFGRYPGEEALATLRSRPGRRFAVAPDATLADGFEVLAGRIESGLNPGRGPPSTSH